MPIKRDFTYLNLFLNLLGNDIYPQPEDPGHTEMARNLFDKWFLHDTGVKSIVDMGCGDTAFMQPWFEEKGVKYTGVAINPKKDSILNLDFTFTGFEDESFDCVLSRHSLEHSPMPLITLMEWHRISKSWLCIVLPKPEVYGWVGANHYAVMNETQIQFLLERAGWHVIWEDLEEKSEIRYMCEKVRK